jgi:hypothetical protein
MNWNIRESIYEISLHSERGILFCAVADETCDVLGVFYPKKQFIYGDFII